MRYRHWFAIASCLVLAAPAPRSFADDGAVAARRPNIVLILADDMGDRSLSCFGGTVPTPNLDRLARGGLVFRNAHAAPMCAPTRDELFTGHARAGRGRPGASVPFFTNQLKALGYTNGMAGKWFVGSVFDPPLRGFDESLISVNGYRHWAPDFLVFGGQGYLKELNQPPIAGRLNDFKIPIEGAGPNLATRMPERYADDVCVEFLDDFLARHRDGPFFAYYATKLPHVPYAPSPEGDDRAIAIFREGYNRTIDPDLKDLDAFVRSEAKRRGVELDFRSYRDGAIAYLDRKVGRLVEKLEELKIRDNTLILFLSDNGNSRLDPLPEGAARLPGGKGDSREGGTRVPLIASWPGTIAAGSTCDDLVHVQDFGPTLVEVAGGDPARLGPCDGRSFAPRLRGEAGNPRAWFVGSGAHESVWLERVAKETGQPGLKPYDLSWVRGLRYKLYSDGRFYDLETDMAEEHRIAEGAGGDEAEAVRARSRAVLDEQLKRRAER